MSRVASGLQRPDWLVVVGHKEVADSLADLSTHAWLELVLFKQRGNERVEEQLNDVRSLADGAVLQRLHLRHVVDWDVRKKREVQTGDLSTAADDCVHRRLAVDFHRISIEVAEHPCVRSVHERDRLVDGSNRTHGSPGCPERSRLCRP